MAIQRSNNRIARALLPIRIAHKNALAYIRAGVVWVSRCVWLLLTFRLLIAIVYPSPISWSTVVFAFGCLATGLILNRSALVGWFIATPFIAASSFFGLLANFDPLIFGFCCLSVGTMLRRRSFREPALPRHVFWLDCLSTWIAVGALVHWSAFPDGVSAAHALLVQPVFGFNDPLFIISNTHLWLTAWVLYRQWLSLGAAKIIRGVAASSPVGWIGIWTAVAGIAWCIQQHYHFPELLGNFVAFAPFEDIHAFGTVVGTLFIASICCVSMRREAWPAVIFGFITITLVALSFSRATWLFVGIGSLGVIYLRCPRRVSILFTAITIFAVGITYGFASKLRTLDDEYTTRMYATRIADLIQVDHWSKQNYYRLHLYQQALKTVKERPWFGVGTGASRRVEGDFAHNFLLQVATESGVLAAVFLLLGLGEAVFTAACALYRKKSSIKTSALLLAVLTYLGTQLTANAICIYSTQIFFLWPLLAMLYLSSCRDLGLYGQRQITDRLET
jgi:hypothetical protein